jgi:hypothetical protein
MTPQEREMIDALFDRLAKLETTPRDAQAERAISDGLSRAPNAIYALVQTTLVQDEALKRADAHIRALEEELDGGAPQAGQSGNGGFLDTMRDSLFGRKDDAPSRGSVPSVPAQNRSVWGSAPGYNDPRVNDPRVSGGYAQQAAPAGYAQQPGPMPGQGGSFLGTAAAAAAGMIGGSLLLNSFRGMMGGGQQHGFGDQQNLGGDRAPWGGSDASGSDLSRDAGLNDIGSGGNRSQGFFDTASNDAADDAEADAADDDFGGDDGGSDEA